MARKTVTIIVNGREQQVEKDELTFREVVNLAFGSDTSGANRIFTVTYKRGRGNKSEGSLVEGQSVRVKEGMVFNVTSTDKS